MTRFPDAKTFRLIAGLSLTIISAGILPGCSPSKQGNALQWREKSRQIL